MKYFDHSQCYRTETHADSKTARDWCRSQGPASMRGDHTYPVIQGERWGK